MVGSTLLRKLWKGDSIGIVAPSFWMEKTASAHDAFCRLEGMGYKLVFGVELNAKYRYTTATANVRAESIMTMFCDESIKAIICLDGGCATIEVIPHLDFEIISSHPKIFAGFSDVTHLNLALLAKANLPTIYGMDIINGFGNKEDLLIRQQNEDFFLKCVTDSSPVGDIPCISEWEVWRDGLAEGVLVGGWLEAIANLVGTDYFPNTPEIILFWETLDCELNEINTLLNRLKLSGVLYKVKGMIIGKLKNCEEREYADCFPRLRDLVLELTAAENFPIIANVDFGHGLEHISMPVGLRVQMDAGHKVIKLVDALVQ